MEQSFYAKTRISVKGSTEFRPKRQCFFIRSRDWQGQPSLVGYTVRTYTIKWNIWLTKCAQQVGIAQADGNVTGAADTLVGLTTLFFALAIATSSIGIAAQGLRNAGLI